VRQGRGVGPGVPRGGGRRSEGGGGRRGVGYQTTRVGWLRAAMLEAAARSRDGGGLMNRGGRWGAAERAGEKSRAATGRR
jgi:hypothetical protein